MADAFTEVSSENIFTRLKNAVVGLLLGPLLVIAAIVLLSWNEGRALTAIKGWPPPRYGEWTKTAWRRFALTPLHSTIKPPGIRP